MSTSVVTVSRLWNNPEIKTTVSTEGIDLSISLDDFVTAVIQEMGSVAMTFTGNQLRTKVDTAVVKVIKGIKEESIKVVS